MVPLIKELGRASERTSVGRRVSVLVSKSSSCQGINEWIVAVQPWVTH